MSLDVLKNRIATLLPQAQLEEGGACVNIVVPKEGILATLKALREDEEMSMDFLSCLTCVDWKTHLTMVYHLHSLDKNWDMVVKAKLDASKPEIETICSLWKGAELMEREVFELFGVHFINHPDLRLLILPEGWEGKNPLRKDFEDPINMIKL